MIIKQSMASTTKAESRLLNSEIVLTEGSVKSDPKPKINLRVKKSLTPINLQDYEFLSYKLFDPDLVDLPKPTFNGTEESEEKPEPAKTHESTWDVVARDVLSPWGIRCREKLKKKLVRRSSAEILNNQANKTLLKKDTKISRFLRQVAFADTESIDSKLNPRKKFSYAEKILKKLPIKQISATVFGLGNGIDRPSSDAAHQEYKKSASVDYSTKSLLDTLAEEEAKEKIRSLETKFKKISSTNKLDFFEINLKEDKLNRGYIRRKSCCSYNWSGGISKLELKTMHIPFKVIRPSPLLTPSGQRSMSTMTPASSQVLSLKKYESHAPNHKQHSFVYRIGPNDLVKKASEKVGNGRKKPQFDQRDLLGNELPKSEEISDHTPMSNCKTPTPSSKKKHSSGSKNQSSESSVVESKQLLASPGGLFTPPRSSKYSSKFKEETKKSRYNTVDLEGKESLQIEHDNKYLSISSKRLTSEVKTKGIAHSDPISGQLIFSPIAPRVNKTESMISDKTALFASEDKLQGQVWEQKPKKPPKKSHKHGFKSISRNLSPATENKGEAKTAPSRGYRNLSSINYRSKNTSIDGPSAATLPNPYTMMTTAANFRKELTKSQKKLKLFCERPIQTSHFHRNSSLPDILIQSPLNKSISGSETPVKDKVAKQKQIEMETGKLLAGINHTNLKELLKESNQNLLKSSKSFCINQLSVAVEMFKSSIQNYEKRKKEFETRKLRSIKRDRIFQLGQEQQ